ncbi:hypothetical protein WIS52_06940 [Pseudonocardia nematodicida]|uniref:Uncharacterized protein n=1 Tax=Pseudonocardia nematodicida TaxID=1206997 RepID=A0ABV1K6T6_9PSEU
MVETVLENLLAVLGVVLVLIGARVVRHVHRSRRARKRSREAFRDACRVAWLDGEAGGLPALAGTQRADGMPMSARAVELLAAVYRQEAHDLRHDLRTRVIDAPGADGDAAAFARARALAPLPVPERF